VPEATVFYCGNFGMLVVSARNTLVLHVVLLFVRMQDI
jgi:hypothetical protein